MSLFSALDGWLHPRSIEPGLRQAIGRAVAQVDPLLKTVGGYERALADAVEHSLAHCDSMVAAITGPVEISQRAFAQDAFVHALFGASDEIGMTIGKSRDLREFVDHASGQRFEAFYALLGMRRHEKKVMGLSLHGEVIQAETPQTLLYFGDHTLKSPSMDAEGVRQRLHEEFFDGLVMGFADQLARRKREYLELQGKARMLRAQARGARRDEAMDTTPTEVLMHEAAAALAPESLLGGLSAWLMEPEVHLHMEPVSVTVDLLGVEMAATADAPGLHTLNFPEMFGRDRRHWLVVLARIPRDEAMAALERQIEANRYIVI